jgi:hypothetical protein
LKQIGRHTREVLDVCSLGTFQAKDFVVKEAVSGFQFAVDGMETFEFGGL